MEETKNLHYGARFLLEFVSVLIIPKVVTTCIPFVGVQGCGVQGCGVQGCGVQGCGVQGCGVQGCGG